MKRLFLILAICLIIALSAIWGYLLFFGAPESTREFFANFNFGNTEETTPIPEPDNSLFEEGEGVSEPTELDALRQLTTKPVAGYAEVIDQASSSTFIYYIEVGTGHIFKLDAITGTEERLSNVTIPNAQLGYIHEDGSVAVVQSAAPGDGELTIVELTGALDTANSFPLIGAAHDFTLTEDREVLYTLKINTGLEGYSYNIETKVTDQIFTLPFREAVVSWGKSGDATHFAYPKADPRLEGYLYNVSNGVLTREPVSGFGLTAKGNNQMVLASKMEGDVYTSIIYIPEKNAVTESNYPIVPEKCLLSEAVTSAVCAVPVDPIPTNGITNWYKGITTGTDRLITISTTEGNDAFLLLIDLQQVSGRNIEAINISASPLQDKLYFQNNLDRTLWLYTI